MIRILICALLASTTVVYCWEHHEMFIEDEDNEGTDNELEVQSGAEARAQLPGVCWACKWIVKRMKKSFAITKGTTPEEVKNKLLGMCDRIGFLKSLCRRFLGKVADKLAEELSTTDDVATICANVHACKKRR
ncbi:hypothetical protein MATL_G00159650 [Megalops atlanticus]|uniref:Saposin B-type domain-containing protein n=1 Tax=Megalops atlanticus TaxID=7932 RepID=A0A9D3PQA3_MEGAT|nr:hypothetical protein MATL_G00159650 [Megalops atlanticus]